MKKEEARILIQNLKEIFDIVRVVDCTVSKEYCLDEKENLMAQNAQCHAIWGRKKQCLNCISAKVFSTKENMTKFEFFDQDLYYVMAHLIEIEGKPFVLELINKNSDETLFSADGKSEFAEKILSYNKKMYIDPLTGAYNRQYLEEQKQVLSYNNAIAMVDVDNLKRINDTKGHQIGDLFLSQITKTIKENIRIRDIMIRYGGDEFLLVFKEMPEYIFEKKLRVICKKCNEIILQECPEFPVSVSIGGYFGQGEMKKKIYEADMMLYQAKKKKNDIQVKFELDSFDE